jgi:hypothetical protein
MRLRAHPVFTALGIVCLLGIAGSTFFVEGLEWSVPALGIFLALISAVYLQRRKANLTAD